MNIFVLDLDPRRCARYHCDFHVGKMITETAQILSTVLGEPYKPTHTNHPCVRWVESGIDNVAWLLALGEALGDEFKYRRGKLHASSLVVDEMERRVSPRRQASLLNATEPTTTSVSKDFGDRAFGYPRRGASGRCQSGLCERRNQAARRRISSAPRRDRWGTCT